MRSGHCPVFQAGMEMSDGQSGLWHRVHGVLHWHLLPHRGLHSARMVVNFSEFNFSAIFAGEIEAGQALEAVAQAKRRRGHRDL